MIKLFYAFFARLVSNIMIRTVENITMALIKKGKPRISANSPEKPDPATTPKEKKA